VTFSISLKQLLTPATLTPPGIHNAPDIRCSPETLDIHHLEARLTLLTICTSLKDCILSLDNLKSHTNCFDNLYVFQKTFFFLTISALLKFFSFITGTTAETLLIIDNLHSLEKNSLIPENRNSPDIPVAYKLIKI
jgi:hypothetical protein